MTANGARRARPSTSSSWPRSGEHRGSGARARRMWIDSVCRTPDASAPPPETARVTGNVLPAADRLPGSASGSASPTRCTTRRARIRNHQEAHAGTPGEAREIPSASRQRCDEIGAVADRMDAEMKDIAYDLRPYQLDTIGLSKTIASMVRRVGKACEVEFLVDISPIDDRFPKGSHVHIFRLVQEAVSNVVKHSRASHARAVVTKAATSVRSWSKKRRWLQPWDTRCDDATPQRLRPRGDPRACPDSGRPRRHSNPAPRSARWLP